MKTTRNPCRATIACGAVVSVILVGIWNPPLKSGTPPHVILEVISRHHTMGRAIPSVYLKVFSNGVVECRTQKFIGKEIDSVKRKFIPRNELEELKSGLEDPELSRVDKQYGLMYSVIDSWIEWDIKVQNASKAQSFTVLDFAPGAARERGQPYPDSIVKLGCSIVKLRIEVYGDGQYDPKECEQALRMQ